MPRFRDAIREVVSSLGGNRQEAMPDERLAGGTTPQPSRQPDVASVDSNRLASVVAILQSLPDPAMILDDNSVLLVGNSLARDLFGELQPATHISRTTRNPELVGAVGNALRTGNRELFELTVRNPVERRLEGAATRLVGAFGNGSERTVLVILQDLSERDALARMRMEFVANASHELRTPLAALSGFIETLNGPAKDDPVARARFLSIMAEQASRMTRLIDDLLVLSRVEMRAHLAPTTIADLNLVAADAVKNLTTFAAKDQTSLVCEPLAGSAKVRGDHDELVQAVHNLVQNAIKYGRKGGNVRVHVAEGQGRRGQRKGVRISVIDDGPGIAPEHVPRLTERFYRVNTAVSRERGGTGLGLAIVKHVVTRHHGTIDIASEVGTGSTFTLAFPPAEARDTPAV